MALLLCHDVPRLDPPSDARQRRTALSVRPVAANPPPRLLQTVFQKGLLEQHRAVATRFDKLAVRYEATIHIAAINQWL
jgi:transposase